MRGLYWILAAVAMLAQEGPSVAILRGELLEWVGRPGAGELSVRSAGHYVHRCRIDDQTYLEKDGARSQPGDVEIGSRVELVVDRRREAGRCYVLTLYLVADKPAASKLEWPRRSFGLYRGGLEFMVPRGNLTFAGMVLRSDAERVVLRTRSQGHKTIRLRDDTYYTHDGRPADRSMLEINSRVFVRAGRNFDGEIEAYQVVRGRILMPDPVYAGP